MSFWDNVKKFAQPYADDEEYDDYDDVEDFEDEEVEEPVRRRDRRRTTEDSDSDFGFGVSSPATTSGSAASTTSTGFSGTVLNVSTGSKQEVILFRPSNFNDTSKAADDLRSKKAVVVNMENVDKAMARRVVDFLSGCAYALDGKVKKIAQSTYLFCPHNMEVVGDLENLQSEVESYI
ncbi:MAG: cell division protein SepF [Oscillospiraceae bacterium]|nr:cell division protein SepF [Oscillospiraceae bacterium]